MGILRFRGVWPKIAAFGFAVLLGNAHASAHEKWFHHGEAPPTCWCHVREGRTITAMAIVAALTIVGAILWRWRGRRDWAPGPRELGATPPGRQLFYAATPLFLAVHLSIPLLTLGISGSLFSPNNALSGGPRFFVALSEIACAIMLFYGACTRLAAALLGFLWILGFKLAGWEAMFENLHYIGFAAFFFLAGRGPYAIDRLVFPRLQPPRNLARWAMPCLRVAVGMSLAFVAFTEKLANPALAASFLQQHAVNFTSYIGWPMCDATFALVCGAIELLVGLWIMFGIFPRTIILIAFIPFNLTLAIFHWQELTGHLPFYGVLAVLLIWSGDEQDQRLWTAAVAAPSKTPADGVHRLDVTSEFL